MNTKLVFIGGQAGTGTRRARASRAKATVPVEKEIRAALTGLPVTAESCELMPAWNMIAAPIASARISTTTWVVVMPWIK